jgi:hypothetical protein
LNFGHSDLFGISIFGFRFSVERKCREKLIVKEKKGEENVEVCQKVFIVGDGAAYGAGLGSWAGGGATEAA